MEPDKTDYSLTGWASRQSSATLRVGIAAAAVVVLVMLVTMFWPGSDGPSLFGPLFVVVPIWLGTVSVRELSRRRRNGTDSGESAS